MTEAESHHQNLLQHQNALKMPPPRKYQRTTALMLQNCTELLAQAQPAQKNLNAGCPFLSILPSEVSLHIYGYALQSRSGFVQYVIRQKTDGTGTTQFEEYIEPDEKRCPGFTVPNETDELAPTPLLITALLRTCKPILKEAKEKFWKVNGLILVPDPNTRSTWVPFPDSNFFKHIRDVRMDFINHQWHQVTNTTETMFELLEGLVLGKGKGCLKELTLVGAPMEHGGIDRFYRVDETIRPRVLPWHRASAAWLIQNQMHPQHAHQIPLVDRDFEDMLELLRKAGRPNGAMAKLKRRIVLPIVRRRYERPRKPLPLDKDATQKVNSAFGGDLMAAGIIRFKDGVATKGNDFASAWNETNDESYQEEEIEIGENHW